MCIDDLWFKVYTKVIVSDFIRVPLNKWCLGNELASKLGMTVARPHQSSQMYLSSWKNTMYIDGLVERGCMRIDVFRDISKYPWTIITVYV